MDEGAAGQIEKEARIMLFDITQLRTASFSCVDYDDDTMWMLNERVKGLYKVSRKTGDTECVLEAKVMSEYPVGYFLLIQKFDNKIFLIPKKKYQDWLIYDLGNETLSYKKVSFATDQDSDERLFMAAIRMERVLVMVSSDIREPIYVVDLKTYSVKKLDTWTNQLDEKCLNVYNGHVTSKCVVHKPFVYFPVFGMNYLVQINMNTYCVNIIQLDSKIKIKDIDYADGQVWILPQSGNALYKWEESTGKMSKIKGAIESLELYYLIVADGNGIVLLPAKQIEIMVYNNHGDFWKLIDTFPEGYRLYPHMIQVVYWHYYKENDYVYVSPLQANMLLEINLNTGKVCGKEIGVPSNWTDEMVKKQWIDGIYNETVKEQMTEINSTMLTNLLACLTVGNQNALLNNNGGGVGELLYQLIK